MKLVDSLIGEIIKTQIPTSFLCQELSKYNFEGLRPMKFVIVVSNSTLRCSIKKSASTWLLPALANTSYKENLVSAVTTYPGATMRWRLKQFIFKKIQWNHHQYVFRKTLKKNFNLKTSLLKMRSGSRDWLYTRKGGS